MNRLLLSAARFGGLSVLSVCVAALSSIFVARALGPSGRGTFSMTIALSGVVVIVSIMGINAAFRARAPRGLVGLSGYLAAISLHAFLAGAVAFAALALSARLLPTWNLDASIIVAGSAFAVSSLMSLALLDGCKAYGGVTYSAAGDFVGAVVVLIVVTIASAAEMHPASAIWCYVAGMLARMVFAMPFPMRYAAKGRPTKADMRTLQRDGLNYAGFGIGQHIALQADVYLVSVVTTSAGTGLYSVAATVANMIKMPASALGQVLNYEAAKSGISWPLLKRLLIVLCATTLFCSVAIFALSDFIITTLFGVEFARAADVLRVLAVAQFLLAPYPILSRVLAGLGASRSVSRVGLVGALIAILTIPSLAFLGGPVWAGVGVSITFATMSVLSLLAARSRII